MTEADHVPPSGSNETATSEPPDSHTVQGETVPVRSSQRWRRPLMMLGVPLLIVIGVIAYWISLQGQISTDNAYVKQDTVGVVAEVAGPIKEVFVGEGDIVKAGDPLFRIDPEPYELAVREAVAEIATAQARVTALRNSSDLSGADIAAAREDIAFAQSRLERQQALWNRGFATKADYDAARHSVEQARESLRSAEAKQREARAMLADGAAMPGINPQVAAAQAQMAKAQLDLKRTLVRAPISGELAKTTRMQVGEVALTGVPLTDIVSQSRTYIEANFKETELADMQVGQPAVIEFDAYPDVELEGHVETIGAGTGSEYSVLPAQNATGNWVKVTQRVPVRIAIDEKSPRKLISGLTTTITVYTNRDE